MRQLFVLATLFAGALSGQAAYSDYFTVEIPFSGEVENGGTVLCVNPSHVNAGFYTEWYDYGVEMLIRNLTDKELKFNSTYLWGSYPGKDEYLAHYEEVIPGTHQWVYGYAKMCSTKGYCYPDNLPDNLGTGTVEVPGNTNDGGMICQLLHASLTLVSEYRLVIYPQGHPADKFECNIVYAPTEEAAREFLGIGGEVIKKEFTVSPPSDSRVDVLSEIEIYNADYRVALNPDLAGTRLNVLTPTGGGAGVIDYDDITVTAMPRPGIDIPGNAETSDSRYYTTKAVLRLKEPLTVEGTYRIGLPEGYLIFGSGDEGFDLPRTQLIYHIGKEEPAVPLSITPEAGPVKDLSGFTINNGSMSPTWRTDAYYRPLCATLTIPDGNVVELSADDFTEVLENPNDFWSPIIGLSYDFDTTYTAMGDYVLHIPAGMFYIDDAAEKVNPEWLVVWTMGTTGITGIAGDAAFVDVYTVDGMTVVSRGSRDRLESLPAGTYIINGKKVRIIR